MKLQKQSLRMGAVVIVCALFLRLGGDGLLQKVITHPKTGAVLLFLETGYLLRPAPRKMAWEVSEQDAPTMPTEPERLPAEFDPEDTSLVEVNSICGYDTDLPAWLAQPLGWALQQDTPTVLILHTHGTESYEKTEDYEESSSYRTLDTDYNVVSIGTHLAQSLEAAGIRVIHDTQMHDHPSYNNSYNNARESMETLLAENPQISMVLDIHRDAVEDDGDQVALSVTDDGQSIAQLMLVVGTDASGLSHPDWPENMSLAVKLHAQLEKDTPGICRPISFRRQRFNQDLSPGALIVEVGSAGNSRQEALLAVDKLAEAIIALSAGTV